MGKMHGDKILQRRLERSEDRKRRKQRERDGGERYEREHRGERQAARYLCHAILARAARDETGEPLRCVEVDGKLQQEPFSLIPVRRSTARYSGSASWLE